jgi:glycosyltransferase involved in cell wall biosynthesis
LIIKKEGLRVFLKKTHLFLRGNKNKKNLQDQYEVWIKQNEDFDVSFIEKEIFDFKYKPKISVITPVYNVDPVWLDKCIESVLNQFYQNWELCLHDDASTKKETIKCLKKWEKKDPRIKISYSKVNQHISGASNEALKLATGEFIALLDNDDELAPHALFENVKVLNEHPDTDFIYSDEDKINREEKRVFPFFKPGWSPDLFYSINYICHLSLMRKAIGDSLGWFRFGFEGAQDYDLFLRFFKKPIKIKHISKILYHWRMLETSTASSIDSKKYANDSGKKALADFIKGSNIKAVVGDGYGETNYRLKFEIPKDKLVSVIILFKDKVDI